MRSCPEYCGLKVAVLVSEQCGILASEIDERSVDLVHKLTLNYDLTTFESLSKRNNLKITELLSKRNNLI
jgi:hypothetical protein